MNIVLVLHSTSIHFSLKYFRFVDPSPHQLFPGDQCGPRSPTCLPHPPPNGPSLRNNGDLKHPSHQPPDLADHNPGAHRFYHQRTSKFFCFGLFFFWIDAITVDGEVLLKKKKKEVYSASFTSEEPISQTSGAVWQSVGADFSHMHINCARISLWCVAGGCWFLRVRQNQAVPLCVFK